jgi:hypothetical protein
MNKRQRIIVTKFIAIIFVTAIAALAMIIVKEYVNYSEAERAMKLLGQRLLEYKKTNGSLPPETFLDRILEDTQGNVRLGKVKYRAIWITLESGPEEIMVYTENQFHSKLLTKKGTIVLRLNGDVEWVEKNKFAALLESQQSQMEKMSIH